MQILYDKIEHQTCKNISQRYGVNENLIKNMYKKATLGEIFKQTLKRIQAGKEGNRWEECIDIIEKHLRGFDRKSLELFEKLSTLDFEIKGVFRQADFRVETKDVIQQANYPVSLYPDISKNVQERILR